jgi:uncharacterized protein DUF669
MFAFDTLTDEEILAVKNEGLLPDGAYSFVVRGIKAKTSQSGNPMLEVQLGVLDKDGNERIITDYLVATRKMMFKLKHFCDAIGLSSEYSSGKFDPMKCIGKKGAALIMIQKGSMKEDGTSYADKNAVRDYAKTSQTTANDVKVDPAFNDDIKF